MSAPLSDLQKQTLAFDAIRGELRYQAERAKNDRWDHSNVPSVEGEILMMEEYLAKARADYTNNPGNEQALHQLRKVVAMGVRAMINHGTFARESYA